MCTLTHTDFKTTQPRQTHCWQHPIQITRRGTYSRSNNAYEKQMKNCKCKDNFLIRHFQICHRKDSQNTFKEQTLSYTHTDHQSTNENSLCAVFLFIAEIMACVCACVLQQEAGLLAGFKDRFSPLIQGLELCFYLFLNCAVFLSMNGWKY